MTEVTITRGERIEIPIVITEQVDLVEDSTFTAKVFFTDNLTTTPDETFDFVANPSNLVKISTGNYEFRRPTTSSDPLGNWNVTFNFFVGVDSFTNTVIVRVQDPSSSAGVGSKNVNQDNFGGTGPVKDLVGQPIPGVEVTAFSSLDTVFEFPIARTTTDGDGKWTLFLNNGNYNIKFIKEGFLITTEAKTII